ncbi:hypothetical protein [Limosilactobacillus sp.]|uniref:hypothetical protein n=1 Tax=Limosilactobacillus sp. TaxID=2773925 RepID=UPI003F05BBB0
MFTMKKKIVSGSLVALMALGLAGCANNASAPASKVNSHPQTSKVAQSSNKKASTSTSVSTSSTSTTASSQSSSQNSAVANTKASYAAQTSNANTTNTARDDQVVNQFIKASGVKENSASQYVVSQTNTKGNYQVEVRDSQGDPNVSHLDGLYRFNPATNQVQEMNPVTGQFENK